MRFLATTMLLLAFVIVSLYFGISEHLMLRLKSRQYLEVASQYRAKHALNQTPIAFNWDEDGFAGQNSFKYVIVDEDARFPELWDGDAGIAVYSVGAIEKTHAPLVRRLDRECRGSLTRIANSLYLARTFVPGRSGCMNG